ncbi:eukaryotic translation initiation factor 3 subunit G-like [Pollicipes pollicipes]|uniref:eukaryotic translation initiation factor 3 subunit G-like n=1 Tax=Pollicipes pollicipes TaxID=41117 RepID=UPI001884E2CA|nr:eukaryotic translation initiation factor 3 subunit G-like [Pollicipes pollicipes]
MPSLDNEMTSWADEVEESDEPVLPPTEEKLLPNGTKIVTEYRINDGKKEKVVTTIKVENRKVSKEVAKRKVWSKFGLSKGDKPGPNTATTIMAEEVSMQFITAHEEEKDESDDMRAKLKEQNKGQIKCRYCKGDHWTTQCPYKEIGGLEEAKQEEEASKMAGSTSTGGKYVPPFMKEGAKMRGESMMSSRGRDDYATVRVTNLSESTRESDLEELFRPFGSLSRTFLAKDKMTGLSKGFAFISFHRQEAAEEAIRRLNGFGYDHLILKVEWSKPSEK